MANAETYLATLSCDTLEQIFRHFLSKKDTLSLVLDPGSPFICVFPNIITKLVLRYQTRSRAWLKENVHQLTLNCTNSTEIEVFRTALPNLGHVFTSITVHDGAQAAPFNAQQFSNVRHLQIVLDEAPFYRGFVPLLGARLKSLSLEANGHFRPTRNDNTRLSDFVDTVGRHCTFIRELTLQTRELLPLLPLWPSIGKSLHSVDLTSREKSGWPATIQSFQMNCLEIRRIRFGCADIRDIRIDEMYGRLLASYGDQLDEANLGIRSHFACEIVASQCHKVRISLRTHTNDNLSRMSLFDDRLTKLNISDDELSHHQVTNPILCRAIETIHMYIFNDGNRLQKVLFLHAKPLLRTLEITSRQPLNGDIFHDIGAATGELLNLRIRAPSIQGIKELTTTNSHLDTVDICLSNLNSRDTQIRSALNIVLAVRSCKKLDRLKVYSLFFPACGWSQKLADAAVPLRRCRVSLLGRRYSK